MDDGVATRRAACERRVRGSNPVGRATGTETAAPDPDVLRGACPIL